MVVGTEHPEFSREVVDPVDALMDPRTLKPKPQPLNPKPPVLGNSFLAANTQVSRDETAPEMLLRHIELLNGA